MLIGVDASRSVSTIQKTGVEKVSDELLRQFVNFQNKEVRFIFYTPQETGWLPHESQRILNWPFKFLWTQVCLAWELIFHPPDIMFFPVHAMPLCLFFAHDVQKNTRYYKIIHDIAFKKQLQVYSFKQRMILNLDLWLAKKICTKIFVPSEAVKDDLLQHTKIKPEKIIVTHWGHKTLNNKFGIMNYVERKKQILYIGRVEEKKNITNLIKAFEIFHAKNSAYKLILAGKVDERFKMSNVEFPMSNQYQNSNEDSGVIFLNYVSEEKKHELLRESAVLVLVSKEEGFGIPLLEAFDFGLPVIASNIPALKEVGGEACLYVNPDFPEEIACGLDKIINQGKTQQALIMAGQERLKEFEWEKTFQKILAIFLK